MADYGLFARTRMHTPCPMLLSWFANFDRSQRADMRILDIPSGAGVLALPLRAAGFDVTPCDLFPDDLGEWVEKKRERPVTEFFKAFCKDTISPALEKRLFDGPSPTVPTDLECVGGDLEARLPFDDDAFDLTLCVEGIEHIPSRHQALAELRRVTKRGGKLIMTTPNMMSLRARYSFAMSGFRTFNSWLDEYTGVHGRGDDGRVYHGHAFLIDYNEIRYSLHHTGWRVRSLLPMQLSSTSVLFSPLVPLTWLMTKRASMLAHRKFERGRERGNFPADTPSPVAEIHQHLTSARLYYGKCIGVEAEAV